MTFISRLSLARVRAPMGHTLPVASRDNVPIIKFPAVFMNLKKVKKNLRYSNSVFFKQTLMSHKSTSAEKA